MKTSIFFITALSLTAFLSCSEREERVSVVERARGPGQSSDYSGDIKVGEKPNSQSPPSPFPDVGYYEGRYYVYFAPGMSLFALPFYYVGNYFGYAQVGTFSVAAVFALLNLIVLYRIGRDIVKFSVPHGLIAPMVFGFASTAWAYSVTLYQHHASTFYILSGVYAVWRYSLRGRFSWVWTFIS